MGLGACKLPAANLERERIVDRHGAARLTRDFALDLGGARPDTSAPAGETASLRADGVSAAPPPSVYFANPAIALLSADC